MSTLAYKLRYPELFPSVGGGVLGSGIGEGINSTLHELPHPLKSAEHLSGWDAGPFDVLGDHLREDAIEGTLVK
jgi:hypothetical protein